jgi:ParB family transcriptional regulator, chromosome partitioning protein
MGAQKPKRLGRGLSGLISAEGPVRVSAGQEPMDDTSDNLRTGAEEGGGDRESGFVRLIRVDSIRPSPFQPRRSFDESALEGLAASVARSGLMQPVIVRPVGGGGYELVAGERRWRAAGLAGLAEIPALVRDLVDEDAAEWALVENLQREELNAIERAHGLRRLSEAFGLSHAELGSRLGLDRSTVANLIRLTELEEEIQAMVANGSLSMGHARALLGCPAGSLRRTLAGSAVRDSLSVRELERAVQRARGGGGGVASSAPTQREAVVADLERRLAMSLGTKAKIQMSGRGHRGRIVVEFYSLEQFEGLMERLGLGDDVIDPR